MIWGRQGFASSVNYSIVVVVNAGIGDHFCDCKKLHTAKEEDIIIFHEEKISQSVQDEPGNGSSRKGINKI